MASGDCETLVPILELLAFDEFSEFDIITVLQRITAELERFVVVEPDG